MRIFVALSLLALTLACANKDPGKSLKKPGRSADAETRMAPGDVEGEPFDSAFYVGYVDYFPETQEFYTSLFYREGLEYPDEELLESKLDSVIVYDDDWGRERLPMEEARKFLVLSGLDTISVFNRRNERICRCPLTRVEHLWNGMESYFVAVFEYGDKSFQQTEELYGIGTHFAVALNRPAEEIEDDQLDDYMKEELDVARDLDWDMRHYRIPANDVTLSVISTYSMNTNEARSYLTSLEKDSVHVLNSEINNFHYLNILPLPFEVNGKPLLLISAGYPSSDVLWDYLAAFDSTTYQPLDYNRVSFRQLNATARLYPPSKNGSDFFD